MEVKKSEQPINITEGLSTLNLILPSDFKFPIVVERSLKIEDLEDLTVSKMPKTHKNLLENCIFLLFFLSLTLICIILLRKTFQRKQMGRASKSSIIKLKKQRIGVTFDGKKTFQKRSSRILNVQDLEYYYIEPRRILWDSYYGQPGLHCSILPGTALSNPRHLAEKEVHVLNNNNFHKENELFKETRSPPPKYKEVIRSSNQIKRVSLLELPSYSEAVSTLPICIPEF